MCTTIQRVNGEEVKQHTCEHLSVMAMGASSEYIQVLTVESSIPSALEMTCYQHDETHVIFQIIVKSGDHIGYLGSPIYPLVYTEASQFYKDVEEIAEAVIGFYHLIEIRRGQSDESGNHYDGG